MKIFFEPKPVIFSTGGGELNRSNDTRTNIAHAIELGADVVRSNVSITRDGKLVLFSNSLYQNQKLSNTGLSGFTADDARKEQYKFLKSISEDTPASDRNDLFPELGEILHSFPDQRFNINLPESANDLAPRFCEIITHMKAQDRILVSCLSGKDVEKVRALVPGIATSFSFMGMIGFYALYRSSLLLFKKKFNADSLIIHERIGATYIAKAGLVRMAHERGILVYVLNVESKEQARRLGEAGVDGYVTNDIRAVRKA